MKTLLSIVAAFAALASAPVAFAHDATATRTSGHYAWKSQPVFGPNKSNLPAQVRVWVKDTPDLASCDCAMMHDTAMSADCMAMPHEGVRTSHG
jgi:hypothetical protein